LTGEFGAVLGVADRAIVVVPPPFGEVVVVDDTTVVVVVEVDTPKVVVVVDVAGAAVVLVEVTATPGTTVVVVVDVLVEVVVDVLVVVLVVVGVTEPRKSIANAKASSAPDEVMFAVPLPGSKSAVPEKYPAIARPFDPLTDSDVARSAEVPPIALAQMDVPLESILVMNTSSSPAEVRLRVLTPGSKSTVELK